MNKFNFTPAGVDEANVYFYSLSTTALQNVIKQVQFDISQWVKDYFLLTVEQINWLDNLDSDFLFLLSNQLAVTMAFRLPFYLIKPKEHEATIFGVKRGSSHNPIELETNSVGDVSAQGSLTFTISYI